MNLNRIFQNRWCYLTALTYEDQISVFYCFVNTYVIATLSFSFLGFVYRKMNLSVIFASTASLSFHRDIFVEELLLQLKVFFFIK